MTDRVATDLFRLTLTGTDGPLAAGRVDELLALIRSGIPKGPPTKGKFRPVEFPDEMLEQVLADIREIVAGNPERERQLAANPPAPDERERLIAEQAERVRQAAARLSEIARLRLKSKELDE